MNKGLIPIYLSFVLYLFVLPLTGIQSAGGISEKNLVSLISMLISGVFLVLSFYKKTGILTYIFYVSCYIWLGFGPLIQSFNDKFGWPGTYSTEDYRRAEIYVLIYILFSHALLFYISRSGLFRIEIDKNRLEHTYIKIKYLKAMTALSFLSLALYLFISGGTILGRMELDLRVQSLFPTPALSSTVMSLVQAIPFLSFAYILLYFRKRNSVYFIIPLISYAITSNPIASPRFWFGSTILTILYLLWNGKYKDEIIAIATTILLIFIFPNSDVFRVSSDAVFDINNYDLGVNGIRYSFLEKGDYNSFQMLMNTLKYVDDLGISYGKQILGAILVFVPREIWNLKPESSGEVIAQYFNYPINNLDLPLLAEGVMDFGGFAIFLMPMIYFYFIAKYLKLGRYSIHGIFFSFYQIFFLRGTLFVAIAGMISVFIIFKTIERGIVNEKEQA